MKVKLQITKDGTSLYAGAHEIKDAQSFGKACSDAWQQLQRAQLNRDGLIGVFDAVFGAICLQRGVGHRRRQVRGEAVGF